MRFSAKLRIYSSSDLLGPPSKSPLGRFFVMLRLMEKIKVKTPKGNIAAVIHSTANHSDRLAILCPGYLDTKDYAHLVFLAEDLAMQGYSAVRFDPIGTWESEGNIEDYTVTQELEDIKSIIDFMLNRQPYPNIVVGGHSRGGLISVIYASKDKRVTEVLAIMSPYALVRTVNIGKIAKWKQEGSRKSIRDIPNSKDQKEFNVPYSDIEDSEQYDVLDIVSKLQIPLIFVAGEKDDVIPVEDVKKFYDRAIQPKELIVVEGIDHNYRHHPDEIDKVNKLIIQALNDHKTI